MKESGREEGDDEVESWEGSDGDWIDFRRKLWVKPMESKSTVNTQMGDLPVDLWVNSVEISASSGVALMTLIINVS